MPQFQSSSLEPLWNLLGGEPALAELGPGAPRREALGALESLDAKALFASGASVDHDLAACCLAGIWLAYDFLDRSHAISQQIETREGSYWHGIMHRREPDYANAKYWFRRVPRHPIFPALLAAAQELAATVTAKHPAGRLQPLTEWDSFLFVDICQAAARLESSAQTVVREIAQAEWRLLLAWCYENAGRP